MKFVFTIICVLFSLLSFSQMRVEDVKNDGDVIKFVKIHDTEEIRPHNVISFCKKIDTDVNNIPTINHFYDSINADRNWFTMDINKDGKLDLIFCGCIQEINTTMIFVSSNQDNYQRLNILNSLSYRKQFAYNNGDDTLFVGGLEDMSDTGRTKQWGIKTDTIIYSKNGLTELNSKNIIKEIDSIRFNILPDFVTGEGNEFIIIAKNKDVVSCKSITQNKKRVVQRVEFPNSAATATKLIQSAERFPYYKYQRFYNGHLFDGDVLYTTIFFADHSKIKIGDHGAVAPFGLQLIYNYVAEVSNTKNQMAEYFH